MEQMENDTLSDRTTEKVPQKNNRERKNKKSKLKFSKRNRVRGS